MQFNHRHIRIVAGGIFVGGLIAGFSLTVVAEPTLEPTRFAKLEAEVRLLSQQIGDLNARLAELAAHEPAPALPPAADDVRAAAVISADAQDLLRAAAQDVHGQISVAEAVPLAEAKGRRVLTSPLHIRTAEREFCLESTPRAFARWRAALAELTRADYVEAAREDALRATYRVTQAGYQAADRLPADRRLSP